jgi:selenocysteine-specific elongation factor
LRLTAILAERITAFHAQHPDEMGPDARRLHRMALPRIAHDVFAALVDAALAAGTLKQTGPWLHSPEHDNRLSADERALFERLIPGMRASPFDPPWVTEHAVSVGAPVAAVRAVLNRAAQRGEAFQVVRDLFYHPDAIRELAERAAAVQEEHNEVKAAAFRDRTGLGRKRAIQVLEFFDRVGYTRRVRDSHLVRGEALRRVGVAARNLPEQV